jgi:hypothetical protein
MDSCSSESGETCLPMDSCSSESGETCLPMDSCFSELTLKIQRSVFVKVDVIIIMISWKMYLFLPLYTCSWKIADFALNNEHLLTWLIYIRGFRGHDHILVGFITTCAINAYHHLSCEFKSHLWRGVLDTTLCNKVCQWLATGRWFSPGMLVSSTNKTDRHDITEILLKVALNTINHPTYMYINQVKDR